MCSHGNNSGYNGYNRASAAQAERAAAEERAAGREHVEELRGRVAARQRWLAEEQAAVDAKIEEATRPAADSIRTHSAAVEALAAEVDALRYPISLNYTSFKQKESKPAKRSYLLQRAHSLAIGALTMQHVVFMIPLASHCCCIKRVPCNSVPV